MSGHLELHEQLERALAEWLGYEAALVFGSGFLTNLGVLTAVAGRDDVLFMDRLNHASLYDGARLSGAKIHRYRHADAAHLEEMLMKNEKGRRRIVVTDSVFSMDGDLAPLEAIAAIAKRHDALLVIDEAHAIGVFGERGAGVCAALPAGLKPDIIVGTLSKSLGSYGGFAACSAAMREFLINKARSFIYSTALPPAVLASALEAVKIIRETGDLGKKLMTRATLFSKSLVSDAPASPIIPLMVGENSAALKLMEKLMEKEILAVAVRPPTVPAGTARLRLSVTLAHDERDLERAAGIIGQVLREAGLA